MTTNERRLRTALKAFALTIDLSADLPELYAMRDTLSDGIRALQSLDDLGTPAANDQAWNDMLELQRRRDTVIARIVELESH